MSKKWVALLLVVCIGLAGGVGFMRMNADTEGPEIVFTSEAPSVYRSDMSNEEPVSYTHLERDGIEYFFRTREEVEAMIQEDQLLEHAEYVGNYYGTPRFYVEDMLSQGKNVILEIEIQGAMKIKEKIPEAVLVFVTPPTIEELRSRLIGRGTETADVIASRLRRAAEESEGMNNYDYILINDQVEDCVDQLHQIILSERCRACLLYTSRCV